MYCKKCGNFTGDSASNCEFCNNAVESPIYKINVLDDLSHNLNAIRVIMESAQLSPAEVKEKFKEEPYVIKENLTFSEASAIYVNLSSKGIKSKINSPNQKIVKGIGNNTKNDNSESAEHKDKNGDAVYKEKNKDTDHSIQETWSTIVKIILVVCVALTIYFVNIEFDDFMYKLKTGDFSAPSITEYEDTTYINMVKTLCPYTSGRSYGDAFSEEFDVNSWSYFESGNKQVVQVTSSYNDIDDTLITQFLITPTSEIGQFEIVPYAMSLSGQNMSSIEMQAVLAAIFDGETIGVLGDLLLYGSLY